MEDYYTTLHVRQNASLEEIKRAYRELARRYHPDLHQEVLDQQIKLLNQAYAVLSNVTKRAAYDAQLAEEQERIAAQERAKRDAQKKPNTPNTGFLRELRKGMQEDTP